MRTVVDANGAPVDISEFIGAASKSHRVLARVDVYRNGRLERAGLKIVSGSATFDRSAGIRGRCNLSVAEPGEVPIGNDGILLPTGYEVRLWRGIQLLGRRAYSASTSYLTHEGAYVKADERGPFIVVDAEQTVFGSHQDPIDAWVSLGFFAIQDSHLDGASLLCDVTAMDRSKFVSDAKLTDAVAWNTSMTLEEKIEEILRDALPSIDFEVDFRGETHSAPEVTHEVGSDPWEIVLDAAQAVGYEAYFDGDGRFVWRPEPDLRSEAPVATVAEGNGGTLTSLDLSWNRDEAYNAWPVVGSNADNEEEYYALAVDDDPNSPTYYYGPYGQKPAPVHRDDQIDTQEKADAAVAALKAASQGIARVIDFGAVPNPLIEPGDVIELRRALVNVNEVALMEKQTIGLGVEDAMSGTARTLVVP